jgi:predicted peroxiredoxin
MAKLVVSITHAGDNPDRATTGFVIAQAAALGGIETVVFLSSEGARLSQRGYGDALRAAEGAPLAALRIEFTAAGGTIWVCGSCFRRRDLSPDHLPARTAVVGGATLVEFLSQGAACLTY